MRLGRAHTGSVHEWFGLWPQSSWIRINALCSRHLLLSLALASYPSSGLYPGCVLVASVRRGTLWPQTTFYPCRRPRRQAPDPVCALEALGEAQWWTAPPTTRFVSRPRLN